jgi:hypothetical protein
MLRLAEIETTVERMCRKGHPFRQVEDVIEGAPASDVQKAALWLLAWTYQERRVQRRLAKEALAAAG